MTDPIDLRTTMNAALLEKVADALMATADYEPDATRRRLLRVMAHRAAERSIVAVLDAIAEPTDAMGRAGWIATNGYRIAGWPDEARRAEFEALGDIGYGDRLDGNPNQWMKPIWRAMFKMMRKTLENNDGQD